MSNELKVIGLMSGTSLDGLDIACCKFSKIKNNWSYIIQHTETIPYSKQWRENLKNAHLLNAEQLIELHTKFGKYIGERVVLFIKKNKIKNVGLVSSHGHTVFHQPHKGFTLQIGDGASIAATTGIKTVCDFRSLDIALGGQGAPLVPIGDELLFSEYDACLNIGGIANISYKQKGKRVAFDICPANMPLNHLALQNGQAFDKGGKLAEAGVFNDKLFAKFNSLSYYKEYKSKSLGREWVEENFINKLKGEKLSVQDKLATVSEHAAFQIARVLNNFKIKNVLITGGGAYNTDLLNRISAYSNCNLYVPKDEIIQFKEALLFAFLGVLRVRNEINTLKMVTGAQRDSSGGAIYL